MSNSTENIIERKKMTKGLVFSSLLNTPATIASETGQPIYEWEYLDGTGELQKDKTNVYEKIQSFRRQTDIKERIALGEEEPNETGQYMDISELGDNPYAVYDYLTRIAENLKCDIARSQSNTKASEDNEAGNKTSDESQKNNEETGSYNNEETGGNK